MTNIASKVLTCLSQVTILGFILIFSLNSCQSKLSYTAIEKIKKDTEKQVSQKYDSLLAFVNLTIITDDEFNRISQKLATFPIKEGQNVIDTLPTGNLFILNVRANRCCSFFVSSGKKGNVYLIPDYMSTQLPFPQTYRPCLDRSCFAKCKACMDGCKDAPPYERFRCMQKCMQKDECK